MYYYEVWVSSPRYHSDSALTYSFNKTLNPGHVVAVPLQQKMVPAVVKSKVKRPRFSTKAIAHLMSEYPVSTLQLDLIDWFRHYYPAPFGQIVSLLLPNFLTVKNTPQIPGQDNPKPKDRLPELTEEQSQVLKTILGSAPGNLILHGDTGTGKTRIYLELAKEAFSRNRSSIILTPEIGLTAQLASDFEKHFPGTTIILHSNLTQAQRRKRWHQVINAREPVTVVGPRSALFSPVHKLGLVVIDEFHETAYKQEQSPYYLASRVAAKLAELHESRLVMGSATPPISDYYAFKAKGRSIIKMKEQAVSATQPEEQQIEVVDLKTKSEFTRSAWISNKLIDAIKNAVLENRQSLVFLNRRGTARLVLCQTCGWRALCPRCDLPLTYHGDNHVMLCHTCGYKNKVPSKCPECSDNDIVFRSVGTKSIVQELNKIIPEANVKRFDSDSAKPERLEQQYIAIKDGSTEILVGTQMIGKGLDLPNLSVVGIITAETGLSFPDYTSEERTYQLLSQALGRISRGHVPGKAVIQTYQPDSKVLKAAITKDYESFYKEQIDERKNFGFPPFRFVLKLTCSRSSNLSAQQASQKLADKLKKNKYFEVAGPSPSFVEKTHNKYHWQIIVKSTSRTQLAETIRILPANWSYDIDPINLL